MNKQQQRVVDSFARVRSFVAEHPARGTLTDTSAREMLDDVLRRLGEHASAQRFGLEQRSAESRRRAAQAELLFVRFIRPIVAIARAQSEPLSDAGLPAALRLPKDSLGTPRLLAVCDSMIEAARPFEALFVSAGLPADFLAAFARERNELERLRNVRATRLVTHLMARTGLKAQFVRGRQTVARLDSIVRESMLNDPTRLAAWRAAKRVHLQSGGAGSRVEAEPESVPADATAGVPETLRAA